MPSKSKSQQRLFGMVHACQKTGECAGSKIKKIAKNISKKDAKDFAKTKHKALPRKVKKKKFKEWLEEREAKLQENDDQIATQMASDLHDEWRKARLKSGTHGSPDAVYEPRIKPSGLDDGKEIDITQGYHKLTPKWQAENKAAAETAIRLLRREMAAGKTLDSLTTGAELESLAHEVHEAWMQRNPKVDYNAAQHVPYSSLPESEKQKDRDHILMAAKILSRYNI